MELWWVIGALALSLVFVIWRWRLAHRERLILRAELNKARADLRQAHALQDDRLHMPLLIDAALEALVLVDDQRRVLRLNSSARELFAPTGTTGQETLMSLTRHHEIDALAEAALTKNEELDSQITLEDKTFRVRALVRQGASGTRVALAFHDVSELQRLSRARRDMVANVSHELRTPITSIRLMVDTLMSGALHDETQGPRLLDSIAAETNTLHQMAQELLDLSMIESGQSLVRLVPTAVDALISEAIKHLGEQARRKSQTLTHAPCAAITALADPDMIVRVLTNLLHNAVKFTPEGGHIRVGCDLDEQEREWVRVSVTDDGPGIAYTDRERVFERFYRPDQSRGGPGTGLGLAIAKHIVEAHGGRIWVAERAIGEAGAQLVFTLPLAATADNEALS